jgi:hypothetical protein
MDKLVGFRSSIRRIFTANSFFVNYDFDDFGAAFVFSFCQINFDPTKALSSQKNSLILKVHSSL